MNNLTILQGDWIEQLKTLPDQSVQCCVTSPPYWGLRDYGVSGQLGLEKTPEEYVSKLVAGFREVWRVLRDDGTLWLNLGDSYAARLRQSGPEHAGEITNSTGAITKIVRPLPPTLKEKDLVGIPWRVAFALQEDGWYLRSDIIWAKPNPMPESVTDRPTKSHEYIFLLSKQPRYYYDAEAIKEPCLDRLPGNVNPPKGQAAYESGAENMRTRAGLLDYSQRQKLAKEGVNSRIHVPRDPAHEREFNGKERSELRMNVNRDQAREESGEHDSPFGLDRNKRTVWTVATSPYTEAHFATFPPDLIKPCIMAGSKPGDVVLDPFGGSGTTGQVALELGRKAILIELNPAYIELINQRTDVTPGLAL